MTLIVLNLLGLSALLWMFDHPYRQFRIDQLRCTLFSIRDDLFARAASGVISFDSPAYGMTRQMLNGMIRFAHELSLWRLVFMMITERYRSNPAESDDFFRRYESALKKLAPEARRAIEEAMDDAHFAVESHLVHTSLITFPLVVLAKIAAGMFWRLQQTARVLRLPSQASRLVDHGAFLVGESA